MAGLLLLATSFRLVAQSAASVPIPVPVSAPAVSVPASASAAEPAPAPVDDTAELAMLGKSAVTGDTAALYKLIGKCNSGNAKACQALGAMYTAGKGVNKSLQTASEYFQKGCDGGDTTSCVKLGEMYRERQGVSRDLTRAAALFQKACDAKDWEGCRQLGFLYEQGKGVPEDAARARALYEAGCAANDGGSCGMLAGMYNMGHGVKADPEMAASLALRACDQGDGLGCILLVVLRGKARNELECLSTIVSLEKGCEHDCAPCCMFAATQYETSNCVPRNLEKAGGYYQKACRLGASAACSRYHVK